MATPEEVVAQAEAFYDQELDATDRAGTWVQQAEVVSGSARVAALGFAITEMGAARGHAQSILDLRAQYASDPAVISALNAVAGFKQVDVQKRISSYGKHIAQYQKAIVVANFRPVPRPPTDPVGTAPGDELTGPGLLEVVVVGGLGLLLGWALFGRRS